MQRTTQLIGAAMLVASSLAFAQPTVADSAIFIGLGGKAGIQAIVATFIPLLLADERIKESFKDSDLKNLALRLEQQFCAVSGGPCVYQGKGMRDIHDGLNVTNAQFNALAEDLQLAMERQHIPFAIQNKLMARLAPMQREIVTQ